MIGRKIPTSLIINLIVLLFMIGVVIARFQGFYSYRPGGALGIVVGVEDYGARWPFQFDHGALMCPDPNMVIIRDPNTSLSYSLTQAALQAGAGWPSYINIMRPDATDEVINELIQRGLKLCSISAR